ncbi:MAG: hypothetical protein ABIQ26_05405 [Streptosporangiaceae bacterium]
MTVFSSELEGLLRRASEHDIDLAEIAVRAEVPVGPGDGLRRPGGDQDGTG